MEFVFIKFLLNKMCICMYYNFLCSIKYIYLFYQIIYISFFFNNIRAYANLNMLLRTNLYNIFYYF